MRQVTKLIKQIRDALAARGGSASVESLATEYARLAEEANWRLESCAAMLEKGSEYQALQLAETEPVLLDLLALLSFAEAREWAAFCAAQHLAVPVRFDARAVQALDALYAKGIRTDHPLYRDYRAAVSSRDDGRAIQIVRSIVRLNPQDANAKAELARLENKLFQSRLHSLRAALTSREETAILAELAELERLATPAKLAECPEFTQAAEVRRVAARTEAIALAERLADSLAEERAAGAWRMVGELLARVRTLQEEYSFSLSPRAVEIVEDMRPYFEKERADAAEESRFQDASHTAAKLADEIETRLRTPPALTLSEAARLCGEFARRWRDVEGLARAVPEDLSARVRTAAVALNEEIARLQRGRRLRLGAAVAAALLLMAVAAWFALRAFSAREYARQLADLQAAGQVEATEKLIAHLHARRASLAEQSALRSRLDTAEQWARDEREQLAGVEATLTALERSATGNFGDAEPIAIHAQLETLGRNVEQLATDVRATPARQLAALRDQFATFLGSARETLTQDAEKELSALENIAGEKLGDEQPKETLIAALDEIAPRLKKLEARAQSSLAALALPPPLEARITAVRQRTDLFDGELALLRKIHEELLRAATLESFQQVLEGFKDSKLPQLADVNAARKMIAAFPKTDDVLASLLMPNDPAGWAAAKAAPQSDALAPEGVQPSELARLLALRDDNYLNDIWDLPIVDHARKNERRAVYSRGEMRKDGPREVNSAEVTTWTGAVFDPASKADLPAFVPITLTSQRTAFGIAGSGEVADSRQSAVSQCLARLELNRMTDANGGKYERPLLRAFDDLVHEKNASPLFKAFLMQQLAAMLRERPAAWGLQYCPRLALDLQRLDELCGGETLRSMDWLLERKRAQFSDKLAPFFNELQNRSYLADARLHREIIRAVIKTGIQFGGFIDGDGHPHILGEAAASGAMWARASNGDGLARCDRDAGNCAKFSPVFYVPADRQALLAEAARKLGIKPLAPEIPFFAAP